MTRVPRWRTRRSRGSRRNLEEAKRAAAAKRRESVAAPAAGAAATRTGRKVPGDAFPLDPGTTSSPRRAGVLPLTSPPTDVEYEQQIRGMAAAQKATLRVAQELKQFQANAQKAVAYAERCEAGSARAKHDAARQFRDMNEQVRLQTVYCEDVQEELRSVSRARAAIKTKNGDMMATLTMLKAQHRALADGVTEARGKREAKAREAREAVDAWNAKVAEASARKLQYRDLHTEAVLKAEAALKTDGRSLRPTRFFQPAAEVLRQKAARERQTHEDAAQGGRRGESAALPLADPGRRGDRADRGSGPLLRPGRRRVWRECRLSLEEDIELAKAASQVMAAMPEPTYDQALSTVQSSRSGRKRRPSGRHGGETFHRGGGGSRGGQGGRSGKGYHGQGRRGGRSNYRGNSRSGSDSGSDYQNARASGHGRAKQPRNGGDHGSDASGGGSAGRGSGRGRARGGYQGGRYKSRSRSRSGSERAHRVRKAQLSPGPAVSKFPAQVDVPSVCADSAREVESAEPTTEVKPESVAAAKHESLTDVKPETSSTIKPKAEPALKSEPIKAKNRCR